MRAFEPQKQLKRKMAAWFFQTLRPPCASLSLRGGPVITSKAGYDDA
jgi:hypothetical protein